MKWIYLAAFSLGFFAHGADGILQAPAPTEFRHIYNIQSMPMIDPSTQLLRVPETISKSEIFLSLDRKQLRLSIQREFNCPRGQQCLMLVAKPYILDFDVTYENRFHCGGGIIEGEAQRNDSGAKIKLEIVDDNGSRCTRRQTQPPATVTLTETAADGSTASSKMLALEPL